MNREGFTLVEVIVVLIIMAVLAAVAIPLFVEYKNEQSAESADQDRLKVGFSFSTTSAPTDVVTKPATTPRGLTQTICIEGYKFISTQSGNIVQILDSYGRGLPCQ